MISSIHHRCCSQRHSVLGPTRPAFGASNRKPPSVMLKFILSHLRQPAGLAVVLLSFGVSLNAQTTNWTAYNDQTPGTTAGWATAPWTTTYNMRGVAGGNAGTVLSGNMTNFDTGAQVPAVFTSTRI